LRRLVGLPDCHADADRVTDGARCDDKPVGNAQCLLGLLHLDDGGELVTADPIELVLRSQCGGQRLCQSDERPVTGLMPVRVVDLLEVVNVDRENGRVPGRRPGEPLSEYGSVRGCSTPARPADS
jgi:hypothetical protein